MKQFKYHILYTSDVHGSLTALDEATNRVQYKGLSRISTYLSQLSEPYLLLDNGDTIQGSPTMYRWALNTKNKISPISKLMNTMKYDYINIGNHDFNFGQNTLLQYTNQLTGVILCANIVNHDNKPVFQPYDIITLENGILIGIIGAVTHYIPHWEKPHQIRGFTFLNAYQTIKSYVEILRSKVDFLVVLYHGGFEKDIYTGNPIGRQTDENQGYQIASELNIDLLLTGHQHNPISQAIIVNTHIMQTSHNAMDFGHIEINFEYHNDRWLIQDVTTKLIPTTMDEDADILELVKDDLLATQAWLDSPIGFVKDSDMLIHNPFNSRLQVHPIYQLINEMQLDATNAMISAASLPNQALGLHQSITIRDIEATLLYPNSLYVNEITGQTLKKALEKSASYFDIKNGQITVSDSFVHPKLEHYNYDVYHNLSYTIRVSNPIDSRIVDLRYQNQPVTDDMVFTLVLNNYRAIGGGDYQMFEHSTILMEIETPLSTLLTDYIKKKHHIIPKPGHHIKIII